MNSIYLLLPFPTNVNFLVYKKNPSKQSVFVFSSFIIPTLFAVVWQVQVPHKTETHSEDLF